MPPVFFLAFLLVQLKPALFFRFPLYAGALFPHQLVLFLLELQRLLCLCADACVLELSADLTLHPLGIHTLLRGRFCRNGGSEPKCLPVLHQEVQDLIVLWLGAEGDLADAVASAFLPFVQADPKKAPQT